MKRVDEEYLANIREVSGDKVAALCKVVSDFLNDIVDRIPHISFEEEKEKLTELVKPFDLFLGDSIGGFATGTKWYNDDKTLWVRWNTWHNYFSVVVIDEHGNDTCHMIYSDKLIDRYEAEIAEIRNK